MAKRTSILHEGEKFFNVHNLSEDLKMRLSIIPVPPMIVQVLSDFMENITVVLMTRLLLQSVKIQKTWIIHPTTHSVFDILVQLNDGTNIFLSWDAVKQITERFDVPHVPEVTRGIWSDLKESFDLEGMTSRVPHELHNLNTVENPESEGVIVRTVTPGYGERYKWKKSKY